MTACHEHGTENKIESLTAIEANTFRFFAQNCGRQRKVIRSLTCNLNPNDDNDDGNYGVRAVFN